MLLKGKYEVLKPLSATSRLARHIRTGRELVVKEIAVSELSSWSDLQQLEDETRDLRSVHHPAVPALVDSFALDEESPDPRFFLVREYVPGKPLREMIGTRTSRKVVALLAKQLLRTLSELHQLYPPLIHGALDPDRVLVKPDGSLAFHGFGLASRPLGEGARDESRGFLAPEREHGPATAASDLFGAGAILYALIIGGEPDALTYDEGSPELDIDLDPSMRRLLDRLLRLDPAGRPASADEALGLLDKPSTAIVPAPETALDRPRGPLRPTTVVAALGALLELVLVFASPTAAAVMLPPLIAALYLSYRAERKKPKE